MSQALLCAVFTKHLHINLLLGHFSFLKLFEYYKKISCASKEKFFLFNLAVFYG